MTLSISQRLKTLAEQVPQGSTVADIGCDHAYLSGYLVQTGRARFVVAGEANRGPYETAVRQVTDQGLLEKIDVRYGDGLEVIRPGEVNVICIAGMGGALIESILQRGEQKLAGVQRLILQPNVGAPTLRKWMLVNGWELIDEEIMEEDGQIYEILVAERGEADKPYRVLAGEWTLEMQLDIGPILWRKKSPVLRHKWEEELEKYKNIERQLLSSTNDEAEERKEQFAAKIKRIEEVLSCMPTDKP